jgi:hypothetical protein
LRPVNLSSLNFFHRDQEDVDGKIEKVNKLIDSIDKLHVSEARELYRHMKNSNFTTLRGAEILHRNIMNHTQKLWVRRLWSAIRAPPFKKKRIPGNDEISHIYSTINYKINEFEQVKYSCVFLYKISVQVSEIIKLIRRDKTLVDSKYDFVKSESIFTGQWWAKVEIFYYKHLYYLWRILNFLI